MDNKFVNQFSLPINFLQERNASSYKAVLQKYYPQDHNIQVNNLLSQQETERLLEILNHIDWQPVGITGIAEEYQENDQIGSYRASCFEEELSEKVWQRLKPFLKPETGSLKSTTDLVQGEIWKPIGVNPLFRFIRYEEQGLLVPHYDASYVYNQNKRTMKSLVIYLEGSSSEGATRFIQDPQVQLDFMDRDYSDWTRYAHDSEIISSFYPQSGNAIIFNHRILHDSQPIQTQQKTIIRTDIVYEKC